MQYLVVCYTNIPSPIHMWKWKYLYLIHGEMYIMEEEEAFEL